MNFETNDIIDERFIVEGICNDNGGMGQILFVRDNTNEFEGKLALKYCLKEDEEYKKRFCREVRLIKQFKENSKVIETLYSNTQYEPPFFVMKYYQDGDLTRIIDGLSDNLEKQEIIFNKMIDCISELHSVNVYHRDIKPQNFLLDGDNVVVSDFGLGMEPNSSSRFTSSSMFWGTQGYLPPEFQNGGFKHADETGDVFMLGKSFYVLLTKQNPTYLMGEGIHPSIFYIIERACELDKKRRYQNLSEMKQALQLAFDVILNRGGQLGEANQLKSTIEDKLEKENKYNSSEVIEFLQKLLLVDKEDQIRICLELNKPFMSILTQKKLLPYLNNFLKIYSDMVKSEQYSWAFAEDIAIYMKKIFSSEEAEFKVRVKALEIAIDAAQRMNRFAAMNTCLSMIASVNDNDFGIYVVDIMQRNDYSFINSIESSQCKCDSIINYLKSKK